ncbi:MAG: DUF4296 domain-containing protein [Bacteroidales bacterium]|jgi:hypothetical protein|nr:DUF4296 domain-containing protein [Bacteroidales bacterium]
MNRKITIVFIVVFVTTFMVSCQQEAVLRPVIFLDQEQMVEIITDLQINNAIVLQEKSLGRTTDTLSRILSDSIFNRHRLSKAIFDSNLTWYLTDPKKMEQIYDAVLAKLQQIQLEKTGSISDPE